LKTLGWAGILLWGLAVNAFGAAAPVISITDSINPGTGEYFMAAIDEAERTDAPYLFVELNTPGGLLSTTRLIVQRMLNSRTPIVLFVGPRGARAGAAGAILIFASDVAIMAPGTSIGAAHPVTGGNPELEKALEDKGINDTATFAESLAKLRGRNADWATRAVKESASITADEALKKGVIDFMAENREEAQKKLSGYGLKTPKGSLSQLPETAQSRRVEMSLKQRLIAFFSDPSLAYLLLALGGLCLWVEISRPGMLFPGVFGGLAVLVSLVAFQWLPINYGALVLVLIGMGMIIAELFLPTFGLLGIGGLVSFILGSLFLMDTDVPQFQISLALILPTAAVLAAAAFVIGALELESRRPKK
jgi:membrane-bound serine protease (ClpP class)